MATWQADFYVLLPSDQLPSDFRERLASVLPAGPSWSDALEVWGTPEGDRIDVLFEPGARPEVFARFDLRQWNPDLYERFLSFVRGIGGELRTADGVTLRADREEFARALRDSAAARFVTNPREFLNKLSRADGNG